MTEFRFTHWPTTNPDRTVTQWFGQNAIDYSVHGLPGHEGIDFRAFKGTSIYAVASGTVRSVQQNHSAYGVNVRVDHDDGYQTTYAHLQEATVTVNEGDRVRGGKVLGKAGDTGNVTGVHLHLNLKHQGEVTPGYPNNIIDPAPFLVPLLDPQRPRARFVGETIPDGTPFQPGQSFEKSWILRHDGGRDWGPGDALVRLEGPALGMPERVPLPPVGAGAEVAVTVPCKAPSDQGTYTNFWQAHDAEGRAFGPVIWMTIKTTQPAAFRIGGLEDLVQIDAGQFVRRGQPFRFLGVNIRGLLHYGRCPEDPLKASKLEHRFSQLQAAHNLGARVVRVFLPDRNATPEEIERRFEETLAIVENQFPDLYLLPAFTNLYNDVPFHVPGDQKFYANAGSRDLLTREFFLEGYKENYLPLVERIVTRFHDRPNIFAWEIGNELKLDRADKANPNDPNPNLFIHFNRQVANRIKELDPHHLVTTGMISTFHSWLHDAQQKRALYATPTIDFLTIHSYKGRDLRSEEEVVSDASLAAALNKPFIVEEAGIDREVHPHRAPHYREHIEHWIRQAASGYMPWGFVRNPETGDGDKIVGFGANLPDFDELRTLLASYAGLGSGVDRNHITFGLEAAMAAPLGVQAAQRPSIVGFDFGTYNQNFLDNQGHGTVNDAAGYGIRVASAEALADTVYWRVAGVHHLTPEENKGKHHVYVDVLDEEGMRVTDPAIKLAWGWEGQGASEAAPPVPFDKGLDEPAVNLMLRPEARIWIRVEVEGVPSDTVANLHSGHPGEHGPQGQLWNSWGHHSFYVAFQRVRSTGASVGSEAHAVETMPVPAWTGLEQFSTNESTGVRWVAAREKLGIDANGPLDDVGNISHRLNNHHLFADMGVGWVRLNFVRGPWSGPADTTRHSGRTWQETYRTIIDNLKAQNVSIYGLIGHEAIADSPGDQFRTLPASGQVHNEWIDSYVENFATILDMFGDDVAAWESFNEPDNWNEPDPNHPTFKDHWVQPEWFAIMLQRIYQRVGTHRALERVPLISGPLQGMHINQNGGARYLRRTYQAGKTYFGWGTSTPFPFDAIGYHLYLTNDDGQAVPQYHQFMEELRTVIRGEENSASMRPIYISEYGWQSDGIGQERQAAYLRQGLEALLDDPSVPVGFWFCTQDFFETYGLYPEDSLDASRRKTAFGPFQSLCRSTREVPVPGGPSVVAQRWTARVTATVLNVRNGPGMAHDKIGSLAEGTEVEVTGEFGGWYRIEIMGRTGFVSAEWVEQVQDAVLELAMFGAESAQAQPRADRPTYYPEFIYGLHEAGGESLMVEAGRPGWILELAAVGLDGGSQPADFRYLSQQGLGVIVRLNHGYGSTGTLPTPDRYPAFANACAAYVARSHGCHIWIIGNEPNHEQERPNGQPIVPVDYMRAYRLCRQAIRRIPGHEADEVLVAGPAPWNAQTRYPENSKGDWVGYFADCLALLDSGECDGFAIHTYTHAHDASKVRGDFYFNHPEFHHRRDEFRTYRDFMAQIPARFRRLPVYITESNPANIQTGWDPAGHDNWVQSAYQEIVDWNNDANNQPIHALILYRWPTADPAQEKWIISTRSNVIADFKRALRAEPKEQFRVRWLTENRLTEDAPPTAPQPQWRGKVTATDGLNLRSGPGTGHAILRTLLHGTEVDVLHAQPSWLFVRVGGDVGYVSSDWISSGGAGAGQPAGGSILERHRSLIEQRAARQGITPEVTAAVFMAESSGSGFNADGRLKINFEAHVFYDSWGQQHPDQFHRHFALGPDRRWENQQWRPDASSPWRTIGSQNSEWDALEMARRLNNSEALRATGMGAPQIMGFHHQKLGYDTVQEMFEAFSTGEDNQIKGFFDFIESKPNAVDALRREDYWTFARIYNGIGQEQVYSSRIKYFLEQFRGQAHSQPQMMPEAGFETLEVVQAQHAHEPSVLAWQDPLFSVQWQEQVRQALAQDRGIYNVWLGAICNSYWRRLEAVGDDRAADERVAEATRVFVDDLERLIDKQASLRP